MDFLNFTITGVEWAWLTGHRPRSIGCNAKLPEHGSFGADPVAILHTDGGLTGWGASWAGVEEAARIVGRKVGEMFSLQDGTDDGFRNFDFPLWDLAGRALGKPVWKLLGARGPHRVPMYDGSIYIEEIHSQTGEDRGLEPVLEGVRAGLERGFRAFKVKIGRGHKWMEREAGLRRDVEVIHATRQAIGPGAKLMVDGNNGCDPQYARNLMLRAGECEIYWFEEPFPEEREACRNFRAFMRTNGWDTLLADGEGSSGRQPEFTQLVLEGIIDVVQFDIRGYGLSRWRRFLVEMEHTSALAAPHNWGSHLGAFYIAQFARGCGRFAMGEVDIMHMDAVDSSAYRWVDGCLEVPDAPGFGLELDQEGFRAAQANPDKPGWSV